jgi:archaemetzincin
MLRASLLSLLVAGFALFSWPEREVRTEMRPDLLNEFLEKLRPLHRKLGEPRPYDWLAEHREPGQTFAQYLQSHPVLPREERRIIFIQPLGDFTATQRRIVSLSGDFLERFFNLTVKIQPDISLTVIPGNARRVHPYWGMSQVLSTYVLDAVLIPRLSADAAAYLAFTASDLWPGQGWNFVFGQASTRQRVGVWSIFRNGDPDKSEADFRLCLLRTLKTAVHETAHMFSLLHCTLYQCVMCGSNHREESDRRPVLLCPECLAKLCWATQADPVERYRRLADFFENHGFDSEARFCRQSLRLLSN